MIMKRLTTLLMTLLLMSAALWADETVTVSANSSDISEGLDLKVVAKLFAEAKNLEEFEMMLNNPDSAFCNLDLNGDGQVDYLRVVETGEGNKRLIVLQAVLAKDIYQDVASIYMEKDDKDVVSVQVVGDEYVYGTNYIIEPVYIYRPVIYDWFWSDAWYAWHSPWYWGYYPAWWYVHSCWAHDWYWHHCYAYHHHHHYCSFRPGRQLHEGYHGLRSGVTRRDYAAVHPEKTFSSRNAGMTNARDIQRTSGVSTRQSASSGTRTAVQDGGSVRTSGVSSRTYGSQHTAAARSTGTATRTSGAATATRTAGATTATRTSATTATSSRTAGTATATRTSGAATATRSSSSVTATRTAGATSATRSSSVAASQRTYNTPTYNSSSRTSSSSRSSFSGSQSGSSSRSSFSSSSAGSSRGGYSGGSSAGSSGGRVSSGGGGGSRSSGSIRR